VTGTCLARVAERDPPKRPVSELVAVVGRSGGKDAIASALATFIAVSGDFSRLRPGERAVVLCLATDRDQAGIVQNYVRGYFERVPLLAAMVDGSIAGDTISLKNGADIVIGTNNYRAPRGRTICCAIYDEVSFWRSDTSATPDFETDAAVTPGLMRHQGSMKIMISSAYRRTGLFYERYKQCYGKDDDDTLVVLGASRLFNPTLDQAVIDRELAKDRPRASSEYLCEWRDDLSSYIDRTLVEELVDRGVRERAYDPAIRNYVGFADEAGGSGSDASTLAIVHKDREHKIIQDLIRIWRPPFVTSAVIEEKARILKAYRLSEVTMDHWAGGLPPSLYAAQGIITKPAVPKSQIYVDFLGILNSRRLLILDEPTQIAELCNLERRVAWGGRESIDHPQGGNSHDDCINALAGAAVLAALEPVSIASLIMPEILARARLPSLHMLRRRLDGYYF
jgi:hypothetical protein